MTNCKSKLLENSHISLNLLKNLIPRHCFFCLEPTGNHLDLCSKCIQQIDINTLACSRCATPFEAQHTIDSAIAIDNVLCGNCLSHHYYYDQVYSPYIYSESMRFLIRQLKYQKKINYVDILAHLFIDQMSQAQHFQLPQVFLAMPMHSKRLKQRGFNQALELARKFSNHYNLPLDYASLTRTRHTQVQAGLSATKRQRNVKQAFTIKKPFNFEHVAIIDDVMTTGSTANEVAKLLKQQKVKQVDVWTIARAGQH